MAKNSGVTGWHSMRKEQLVQAILKLNRKTHKKKPARKKAPAPTPNPALARKMQRERIRREKLKDLALVAANKKTGSAIERDRIILIVRDAYWLHTYWEITKNSVARAKAALAENWLGAQPILRLLRVSADKSTGPVEDPVRDIPIHGGVKNWYIDMDGEPTTLKIQIGYKTADGKFYLMATSNTIGTPESDSEIDEHWTDIAEDHEKFYSQSGGYEGPRTSGELQTVFEEKLRRPMHSMDSSAMSHSPIHSFRPFDFEVDAHMVVYGATAPNANVSLAGEPVKLNEDGTFVVRMGLPDRRQVLPIVASSRDGSEQRTTVLAVERNTKVMEPITKDLNEF